MWTMWIILCGDDTGAAVDAFKGASGTSPARDLKHARAPAPRVSRTTRQGRAASRNPLATPKFGERACKPDYL
jgi:hypothetical protein